MRRTVGGIVALLLALPALADDKPKDQPTPEEQYKALVKDYSDALRQVKTLQERNKLVQETAPKFLELAEKNPKDPVAVDALVWVVNNTTGVARGKESPRAKALAALLKEHVTSDRIGRVCPGLVRSQDKESADLLRAILDKNPDKDVQGLACLSLAQQLKGRADRTAEEQPKEAEKLRKESEELFERAADKYADVKFGRGKIGDTAKTELFELRFLSIGKEAPDIEDEDIDGKKFKLSDYRGKVVLLDFWGDW
jgi:hypothetical protein